MVGRGPRRQRGRGAAAQPVTGLGASLLVSSLASTRPPWGSHGKCHFSQTLTRSRLANTEFMVLMATRVLAEAAWVGVLEWASCQGDRAPTAVEWCGGRSLDQREGQSPQDPGTLPLGTIQKRGQLKPRPSPVPSSGLAGHRPPSEKASCEPSPPSTPSHLR